MELPERVLDKIHPEGDCLVWHAAKTTAGYGVLRVKVERGRGKNVAAHRWIYEQVVGPIPEGLDLDHLCRVRACVNPEHMEPVTRAENLRRGAGNGGALSAPSRFCRNGHDLSLPDARLSPDRGRKLGKCRLCARAAGSRYYRKGRADEGA